MFLGAAGVRHIAEGLRYTPLLTTLNISGAKMGDEGAVYLAAAFRHVPNLTRLDLCQPDQTRPLGDTAA